MRSDVKEAGLRPPTDRPSALRPGKAHRHTRGKKVVINFRRYAERLLELNELYLKIQMVSGYTVDQLLEMFMAGYTMEPPSGKNC